MINLFDDLPGPADEELFTELLRQKGVRIERIVLTGQSTARRTNPTIRNTTSGFCSSPARPVYGSREKANASYETGWLCPDPRSSPPSCNVDGERRAYRLARRTLLLTTHGLRERPLPDLRSRPTRRSLN